MTNDFSKELNKENWELWQQDLKDIRMKIKYHKKKWLWKEMNNNLERLYQKKLKNGNNEER
jgi:hypothetical protein